MSQARFPCAAGPNMSRERAHRCELPRLYNTGALKIAARAAEPLKITEFFGRGPHEKFVKKEEQLWLIKFLK